MGGSRALWLMAAALVVGIAARGVLLEVAPRYAFFGDHVDYVCWAREAVDAGVLEVYTRPPGPCPARFYPPGEQAQDITSGANERLNYPPLAAYVFWLEGLVLRVVDPARIANTVAARSVLALSTTIAELAAAIGVAALVVDVGGPMVAAVAFAATWLAPPILADGPFWGQTESWILGPSIWMVWAMNRQRWLLAGVLWGIALALKPSGVLLGPLWAYALLFRDARPRIVAGGLAALATLNFLALPFWLWSGIAWLRLTYLANYVYNLHWTTMMTFNVWYADLLVAGHLDSQTTILGVTRDTWGTVLLLLGVVGACALTRRWETRGAGRAALAFVPLATLVTLAAVTFPTRVHGTYTAFTAPFLIATACFVRRARWPATAMIVAATLQILSWQWANLLAVHVLPDESRFPPARQAERRALRERDLPREWALILLSLGATAATFAAVARDDEDA
ncbi:MAG TPA: hypothetical protein VGK30_16185 [Candidatus Binatia bacterium]